ncbi:MAG TPA: hypothetical protein PKY10_00470 [Lentisphaeria bacterium]|nr:hypothetical protein [Lentisphaeria bacterium]
MFANRKKSRLSSHCLSWLTPLCFLAGLWSILAFGFEIRPFQGDEVTGNNVLALWQFQPGAELVDSKGEATLELCGRSLVTTDSTFGGALECFEFIPGVDKPNGARADRKTAPVIDGAFSIEAWVKLKETPDNPDWNVGYIVDKMYVPNTHERGYLNKDYHFSLRHHKGAKKVSLRAGIGLGAEVINFTSEQVDYAPGVWRLMAFYYNGAGTGMFFVDGRLVGKQTHEGKGSAAAGIQPLMLGERCGSIHSGLPGYLAQVRIVKGLPSQIKLINLELQHPFQRNVFERLEVGHALQLRVSNLAEQKITNLALTIHDGLTSREERIGDLPPNSEPVLLSLPLRCDGKVGDYTCRVDARGVNADGQAVTGGAVFDYQLCRRLPEFMPVVMWGGGSIEQLLSTGFTHGLHWLDHLDYAAWEAGEPLGYRERYHETRQSLNQVMAAGLRALGKMSPGAYFKSQPEYAKVREDYLCHDRQGKPTRMVNFSLPRVQQFAFDAARTMANSLKMYPVIDIVLTDSEFRDGSRLSFRAEDIAALRTATGLTEVPAAIEGKGGVKYARLPDFPASRIIPEDHPILVYYRWLWGGGDGYPGFLTQAWKGLNAEGTAPWKVVWDPVVRCPSKWGSGGAVDLIGHWTYVYPDPLVMGLAADEVLAMCKGGPSYQEPTKMTQIIWYRSGTTGPLPEDKSKWNEWEKRLPDAKFITIPPDMLEIALWQKLSRAVKAVMYHGSGSLWDKGKPGGYDFTHPGTQPRLAELTRKVIKPFGPMLLKVPERKANIAMLESFASQMFYGGTTHGTMANPVGRMHAALARAHLQPEIIYDETILRDGLDQFTVLVMPMCAVLSADVAVRIQAWQAKGGVIVADEMLAPGITPDVLLPQLQDNDKDKIIACSKKLRQELDGVCQPLADADTADAVLRVRSFGTSDYLFAFNDKRTYGDYVGQYRKVMEKGLPLSAQIRINRPQGTVYDLLAGKAVATKAADGSLAFAADFGPGEGRIYLVTEQPLAQVQVTAPAEVARGKRGVIEIKVLDAAGQPVDAVVPLQIQGSDPEGQPLEIVGWYAAVAGKLSVPIDIAPNDAVGAWKVQVRELASGLEAAAGFNVR